MKEKEGYVKQIQEDLAQAFRIIDKWSFDDSQNSVVSENILLARCALQKALESINFTQKEIDEQQEAEEQKKEELEEQEHEFE